MLLDLGKPDSVYSIARIFGKDGHLNAGSIFAAVFFPIVILLSGLFVYIRYARAKQSKKRQRWSKAIGTYPLLSPCISLPFRVLRI